MADSALTKQRLADALKELMQTRSLARISVGDITAHCGTNRQTFYYHFKDKYDLVGWIYSTETLPFMGSFSDRAHWTDGLRDLCLYVQQNKKFYVNALNTPGQNSFEEYLTQFLQSLISSLIETESGGRIAREDRAFIADFYAFAFVGLVMKWARGGMKEDPAYYVGRIRELINGSLLRELEKYK